MKMLLTAGAAALACLAVPSALAAPVTVQTIALSGEAAPGTGGVFGSFDAASVNDEGQVAFTSSVGVFRYDGTSQGITLLIAPRDVAPGTGGAEFIGFGPPAIDASGEVGFLARVTGAGTNADNDLGLFRSDGTPGGNVLIVREGQPIPQGSGLNFRIISGNPSFNDAGQVAFRSFLDGNGPAEGIFVSDGTSSGTSAVALEGAVAAGTNGARFDSMFAPSINDAGQVVFRSRLQGSGVNASNDRALFRTDGTTTGEVLLAREGDTAPGTGGASYSGTSGFIGSSINGAGEVAFLSELTGVGVTSDDNSALFLADGTAGGAALLVREGDLAPGGSDVFAGFSTVLSLNDLGQVAFLSNLIGADVDTSNDRGLFAVDADGTVVSVLREGDLLEVAAGDFRTVSFLSITLDALNDAGQIAFTANFADGTSGVFLADAFGNVAPVPVPGALLFFVTGAVGLAARRRAARSQD